MTLFDAKDYKSYLKHVLSREPFKRGGRSQLAHALGCQSGFITQVLNGASHFSLEHGMKINKFLRHSQEEAHYFLLLIQQGRAGSKDLEEYFQKQLNEIQSKRREIKERIGVRSEITEKEYALYYSHWYYAAIHVLTSIPAFQTKAAIAKHLGLSEELVGDALTFLNALGLVKPTATGYTIGETRIHLPPNSPLISKHHTNWRVEGIKSLERQNPADLHYSAVVSLSKADTEKIREIFLDALSKSEKILTHSPEEQLCGIALDFFTY